MKRLLFIAALFVWCMACTNHEQKTDTTSGPGVNSTADSSSHGDTASYERMPQQTTDSIKK
jgi:hypothetical protein